MSRPVTAWTMSATSRRHYPGVIGRRANDAWSAAIARNAYRAMRKAGMESFDARRYVLLLLTADTTFTQQKEVQS